MEQAFERRPWLLPAVLALLTVVLLRPLIFTPDRALTGGDWKLMFYPAYQGVRQMLQAGELPLWNVHEFIGHPIADNPQIALFYPATWAVMLIGVQRGMMLVIAFHTWLAAWGMARLTRSFEASQVGGLLAGVIYAMSGMAGARYYAGHYTLLLVLAWIPWVMTAYRHALARGSWRSLLPGIAALGLSVLAGHPPMLVYLLIASVTLLVYHAALSDDVLRAGWYAAVRLAVLGAGGLILGAALVIPAAELTAQSTRNDTDLSFANSYALPPAQLITLALPGFFGSTTNGPTLYWGADYYQEYAAYGGLLALLAIPLALRFRQTTPLSKHLWYFIGLFALGLILSVGTEGALMPLLVRWIPGFGLFRVPGRALLFAVMGMAGATALLVTALQSSAVETLTERLQPALKLWIPLAAAAAFVGAIAFSSWYANASQVDPMPTRAFYLSGVLAEAGVILAGVWIALWLWSQPDSSKQPFSRWALLVTCLVVIFDAWHVFIPQVVTVPIQEEAIWAGARINVPLGADARVIAPLGTAAQATVTGHLNVAGDDPLIIETYRKLRVAGGDVNDPTNPVNALLGVKYLLVNTPVDKPNFKLIGIADSGIYYQRTDPFPRAWIAQHAVVEPNDDSVRQHIVSSKEDLQATVYIDHTVDCPSNGPGTAQITEYRPNDVAITTAGGGGILTVSDQYYPGWNAMIDGQQATIIRADTAFRAVCVPPGSHTVTYEYRPLSLLIGLAVSAVGWLVLIALSLISWRSPA